MRKTYFKPMVEIEAYTLKESIAANCGDIVKIGPGDYSGYACEGMDIFAMPVVGNSVLSTSFYDGSDGPACDCYYSAGGEGFFTS